MAIYCYLGCLITLIIADFDCFSNIIRHKEFERERRLRLRQRRIEEKARKQAEVTKKICSTVNVVKAQWEGFTVPVQAKTKKL